VLLATALGFGRCITAPWSRSRSPRSDATGRRSLAIRMCGGRRPGRQNDPTPCR